MKQLAMLSFGIAWVSACAPTAVVPDKLLAPTGQKLVRKITARGVQIYGCLDQAWTLTAPEADLYDDAGARIGKHYAGPTWELGDGGKVVGAVKEKADAPLADAIPWLLLDAKSAEGSLHGVKSIQRLDTTGGKSPAGACAATGAEQRVEYTASYYFYE